VAWAEKTREKAGNNNNNNEYGYNNYNCNAYSNIKASFIYRLLEFCA
jgi:hypothetical protein